MPGWLMWTLAALLAVAPWVLMLAFNGTHVADSRGRRLRRSWSGRPLRPHQS